MSSDPQATIETLFGYLYAQGDSDYLGEAVSQLEHSLQAAALAASAKAGDEVVLAALLHDVGRFLPRSTRQAQIVDSEGNKISPGGHDAVGESYLRSIGFSGIICDIVGAHVWAKRYLCATEPGYWDDLSNTSKASLVHQGGAFTPEQVEEAKRDPLLEAKVAVRRWDDQAKVAGISVPGLETYREMAVRLLSRH